MANVTSHDSLKNFYLNFHKTYEHKTWQGGSLWMEVQHANAQVVSNFSLQLLVTQKVLRLAVLFFYVTTKSFPNAYAYFILFVSVFRWTDKSSCIPALGVCEQYETY